MNERVMTERGLGRVYRPTRQCRRCKGAGCPSSKTCKDGRRDIQHWHIQYSCRNQQFRESSHSRRKSVALALLKKRMAEMGAEKRPVGPRVERTDFEGLCELMRNDYRLRGRRSTRRLDIALKHLAVFFAGWRAVDITTDALSRYANARFEEGKAPATVRNELNALRRAFRLAKQADIVRDVPHFPTITVDNTRTGFFEAEELARVVAALPEPLRPVVQFGHLSGWRIGEILPLRWAQVDFIVGVIRLEVGSTKNGDGRVLPVHALPPLKDVLDRQLAYTQAVEREQKRVVPFVFHRAGKEIKAFEKVWKRACRDAGCPGRLFHDLRRTAVRNLERANVPRSIAMKITGHRTEAIYRRYAIVSERDVAEGLGRLARFLEGGAAR